MSISDKAEMPRVNNITTVHEMERDSLELPSIRISHMAASFWSLPKLKTKTATARQLIEQRLVLKVEWFGPCQS